MSKIVDLQNFATVSDQIGSRIVKQAAQQALAEQLGAKTADADVVFKIEKGEMVPASLRGEPNMSMDANFAAIDGWEKNWLNLIVWDRNWSEAEGSASSTPTFDPLRIRGDLKAWAGVRKQLTRAELAVMDELKAFD